MTNTDKTVSTERLEGLAKGYETWGKTNSAQPQIDLDTASALRELLAIRTQSPAIDVDELAQIIRTADGGHMQGAGQLAERIVERLNLRAATLPAPERSKEEVGVKPLEWKPFTSDEDVSFMFAAEFGVRYEVFHKASDVAKIGIQVARMQHVDGLLSDDDDGDETTTIIGYGKDLAAAYAIAQADFDTLVLSALETPPLHKEGEAEPVIWMEFNNKNGFTGLRRWTREPEQAARWKAEPDAGRFEEYYAAPVPVPVTIDDTAISARFNRLYGICRRILWADASTPAIGSEQTKAALADLAEFLFADGIDAALSKPGEQG